MASIETGIVVDRDPQEVTGDAYAGILMSDPNLSLAERINESVQQSADRLLGSAFYDDGERCVSSHSILNELNGDVRRRPLSAASVIDYWLTGSEDTQIITALSNGIGQGIIVEAAAGLAGLADLAVFIADEVIAEPVYNLSLDGDGVDYNWSYYDGTAAVLQPVKDGLYGGWESENTAESITEFVGQIAPAVVGGTAIAAKLPQASRYVNGWTMQGALLAAPVTQAIDENDLPSLMVQAVQAKFSKNGEGNPLPPEVGYYEPLLTLSGEEGASDADPIAEIEDYLMAVDPGLLPVETYLDLSGFDARMTLLGEAAAEQGVAFAEGIDPGACVRGHFSQAAVQWMEENDVAAAEISSDMAGVSRDLAAFASSQEEIGSLASECGMDERAARKVTQYVPVVLGQGI